MPDVVPERVPEHTRKYIDMFRVQTKIKPSSGPDAILAGVKPDQAFLICQVKITRSFALFVLP